MKIIHTSPSDLELYFSCPNCWWLKHQGHRQQTSPAMQFGLKIHKSIELYHREGLYAFDPDAQIYLNEYMEKYDRDYDVIEEFWKTPLFDTGIMLNTKVDLVKNSRLVEHKTASFPYTQEFVDNHRQLTAYIYSWRSLYTEKEDGIIVNIFNTNPKPDQGLLQILETTRSEEDLKAWESWVREILAGIEADYFEVGNGRFHNFFDCPKYNVKGGDEE